MKKCDKICFTVIGGEMIKDEAWAPYVKSAVVFGRCHLIEDQEETLKTLKRFAMKYYPNEQTADDEIDHSAKTVRMFEIEIEHTSQSTSRAFMLRLSVGSADLILWIVGREIVLLNQDYYLKGAKAHRAFAFLIFSYYLPFSLVFSQFHRNQKSRMQGCRESLCLHP